MFGTRRQRRTTAARSWRRTVVGAVGAVALGVSVLSGCAAGQISQSADVQPNLDGGLGSAGPVAVHNVLIVQPDSDAGESDGVAYSSGSTAELTLQITNDSDTVTDTLTSVTTELGEVTLSGDATIEPASSVAVGGEGGAMTATIAISQDVKFGFSYGVTFSFAHAGDVTTNVPVAIPSERTGDRATTDIYPPEESNVWGD